ncbi:MAG: hypothetical protein C4341_10100 [Armatimonadota bacterium]
MENRGSEATTDAAKLLAEAAALGPGYRGTRLKMSDDERVQRAKELMQLWDDESLGPAPEYLVRLSQGELQQWLERRAKLFEIGEYDDKGLVVREEDLQRLADNFEFPVGVLIEHIENPLRLGYLTSVEALGPELFGTLSLTPEADTLLEKSGARSLSLSVSRDLDRIFEVSIVSNPRVETARLFCADFRDSAPRGVQRKVAELQERLRQTETERLVDDLVRKGQLPPASRESAVALLFSAREEIRGKVEAFLESLPPAFLPGEIVPMSQSRPEVSSEEADFYARTFPDLDLGEILKRRRV